MEKISIPFSEFTFSFSRSGGAGGQNINKVNTKVIMEWHIDSSPSVNEGIKGRFRAKYGRFLVGIGKVQIVGQSHRTQKANIDECIEKLHSMLNEVRLPPKIRKKTKPKKSAVLKRLDSKRKDSEKKLLRKKNYP